MHEPRGQGQVVGRPRVPTTHLRHHPRGGWHCEPIGKARPLGQVGERDIRQNVVQKNARLGSAGKCFTVGVTQPKFARHTQARIDRRETTLRAFDRGVRGHHEAAAAGLDGRDVVRFAGRCRGQKRGLPRRPFWDGGASVK